MKDGGEFFANLGEKFIPTTEEQNNAFFESLFKEVPEFQDGGKTPENNKEKNSNKKERIAKLMKEVIEPAAKAGNKTAMRLMDMD